MSNHHVELFQPLQAQSDPNCRRLALSGATACSTRAPRCCPTARRCCCAASEDRRGPFPLYVSRVLRTASTTGEIESQADAMPADPEHFPEEVWGIEDPRITYIAELKQYAVVYTAFSRDGPGVSLALTEDFHTFERYGVIMSPEDKDARVASPSHRRSVGLDPPCR